MENNRISCEHLSILNFRKEDNAIIATIKFYNLGLQFSLYIITNSTKTIYEYQF
jgi:hypothetical protein